MRICFFGTYDRTYTSNLMILKGLKENGVSVVEVNAHIKVTKLTTKDEMSLVQVLKRVLRKYRIVNETYKNWKQIKKCDVIYVGYPGHVDVFFAWLVAKLLNIKLVFNPLLVVYVGFSEERPILNKRSILGFLIKNGESLAYKICDMVFADTPFQEEHLKKYFGIPQNKLKVLPIGADDTGYKYTPYKNDSKKVNVVYYGLYSPIHGVEHIIEAARRLRNDKDVKFTFVGYGGTFQENFDRAQKLKLPNVEFFNNTPEKDHLPILQKADIFLGFLQKHPSVDRVIPNKVYQGLSLGRVVLTADSPVTRSVFVHKKNMYLVKAADPKALVNAILELKNNPKLRVMIAKNGYDLYRSKFTPKAVGKKLLDFIGEII